MPPTSTYEASSLSLNANYSSSYSGSNHANVQNMLLFHFNQREKLEITRIILLSKWKSPIKDTI